MAEGVIIKALSGFYYILSDGEILTTKAKGNFRYHGLSPLAGDIVEVENETVKRILPRKNSFIRPAVANVDTIVFFASAAKPVTDPFLIDRVSVIAQKAGCELIVALNKTDIERADELYGIYSKSGFEVINISALTGEGIDKLREVLKGKISVFTGNSGVGKSSVLNCLIPGVNIETDEISQKLGRGKHTTRHVEFYKLDSSSFIADTPGYASFEIEMIADIKEDELEYLFPDFADYIGSCRFTDCRHLSEPGCAVLAAIDEGRIMPTRHESYVRLYEMIKDHKPWD